MEKTRQFMTVLSRKLELPSEILAGDPVVELKGKSEATVLHHRGITGYTDECVCVATSVGGIRITGCGLQVFRMNQERIVVYGEISCVQIGEKKE